MAKTIMIQGTMSSVGKSILTTGLCRLFKQDGYKVAPFKSQNMSRNVYVTDDGLIMSKTQAIQAEACGLKPEPLMNPVLLKPLSDTGSTVYVNGKPLENMGARDYFKYKENLIPHIMNSFNTLNEKYDIIVLEGAGSPAEINLKDGDIVNMGLAAMTNSPVLLVGDIDCGGVFAQLFGTLSLLTENERNRVKGLIINKFRGDIEILKPGLLTLEQKCHKPILGVISYLNIDIEEEDSLIRGKKSGEEKPNLNDNYTYRLKQYDILAEALRKYLDIDYVYRILNLSERD